MKLVFLVIVVFVCFFSFTRHSIYECNGDWDKSINCIKAKENDTFCIKEGYGTCRWEIGLATIFSNTPLFNWACSYTGEWKEDKKNGVGTFYSMSGSIYKGNWVNNTRNGFGELILWDNTTLSGYWKNDELSCSSGKLNYSKNLFYEGNLNNAKMHGSGKLYVNKFIIFAHFCNGTLCSDSGEILLNNEKVFSIEKWFDSWEFLNYKSKATVYSTSTKTHYKLEDKNWSIDQTPYIPEEERANMLRTQEKEIALLHEILENVILFEDHYERMYMQIVSKPYEF